MTKAQSQLMAFLKANGRLPEVDEAVDLYVAASLRSGARCLITAHGPKTIEHRYPDLQQRATSWLKTSLGSLAMQGKLTILIDF